MSVIKECFTSRYLSSGEIVNFDYSQLEVVALAVASKDVNLKKDIMSGIDIHSHYCKEVFGKVTPSLRTYIKRMTFQLQYGAQAYGMHKSLGLELEVCKKFINEYFDRYSGVKAYHDFLIHCVETASTFSSGLTQTNKMPTYVSTIPSRTGRDYFFSQSPRQKKNYRTGTTSTVMEFKPTEIKNYPVQGLATGDLVPIMVGQLFRFLLDRKYSYAMLINTVHDSIMLDVNKTTLTEEEFREFLLDVKGFLESAPEVMNSLFPSLNWDIPLTVSVEHGESWGDLKEYRF